MKTVIINSRQEQQNNEIEDRSSKQVKVLKSAIKKAAGLT